jgi:hypothetical protein
MYRVVGSLQRAREVTGEHVLHPAPIPQRLLDILLSFLQLILSVLLDTVAEAEDLSSHTPPSTQSYNHCTFDYKSQYLNIAQKTSKSWLFQYGQA